jgi:hypothetical protein
MRVGTIVPIRWAPGSWRFEHPSHPAWPGSAGSDVSGQHRCDAGPTLLLNSARLGKQLTKEAALQLFAQRFSEPRLHVEESLPNLPRQSGRPFELVGAHRTVFPANPCGQEACVRRRGEGSSRQLKGKGGNPLHHSSSARDALSSLRVLAPFREWLLEPNRADS